MKRLRLRTQLLIATLLLIGALTSACLLIVRYTVRSEVDRQVVNGMKASVRAFESVERQRESQLSKSAAMLAELPPLKSLMTTEHEPTIQDGSLRFWKLAGSDLLVLATDDGRLMALHVNNEGWSRELAIAHLKESLNHQDTVTWWYGDGRLYSVFIRPITAGSDRHSIRLGYIALGYQVDSGVAEQLARVAGSHIALTSKNEVIASTLQPSVLNDLKNVLAVGSNDRDGGPFELRLAGSPYEVASVLLQGDLPAPVRCFVLMPLARTTAFMDRLNRTIAYVGFAAVLVAGLVFIFISRAVTRPLDNLVAGVRALAAGDYSYSIPPRGSTEIAELAVSFANMRTHLKQMQLQRIEAERVAALGRTASSISHDLRHYLAAVVANAEFLYEMDAYDKDRREVYEEIQTASDQMLDLIDSLRELAREQGNLNVVESNLEQVARRAVETVNARPDFRKQEITVRSAGDMIGTFDPRKIERVFFNLALNACEATNGSGIPVKIDIVSQGSYFEIRVIDHGPGIPDTITDSLFDPFVSSGKPNGTGLGLAIVSKIVHDHGGEVSVERTSSSGTVFLVHLPRATTAPEVAALSTVPA